jgi:hypothetical protein
MSCVDFSYAFYTKYLGVLELKAGLISIPIKLWLPLDSQYTVHYRQPTWNSTASLLFPYNIPLITLISVSVPSLWLVGFCCLLCFYLRTMPFTFITPKHSSRPTVIATPRGLCNDRFMFCYKLLSTWKPRNVANRTDGRLAVRATSMCRFTKAYFPVSIKRCSEP